MGTAGTSADADTTALPARAAAGFEAGATTMAAEMTRAAAAVTFVRARTSRRLDIGPLLRPAPASALPAGRWGRHAQRAPLANPLHRPTRASPQGTRGLTA